MERKIIQDGVEGPLVLYSEVRGPLAGLSFLRRSLVLAELSMIAYNDEAEASAAARAIGFVKAQLVSYDGSQAYLFSSPHDMVLACRGTQLTEWNDIEADAYAVMSVVGTFGRVHSGFYHEVNDLWPMLETVLRHNDKPVWFCGHSLGAAMSTICAYRCKMSAAGQVRELHTFGSPRVGNKRYARHAGVSHYRWVHNNDVVTQVPPVWMGYRHGGIEVYLDSLGRLRALSGLVRFRDRWRGLLSGLMGWEFDLLSDHSIGHYARHIASAVAGETPLVAKHVEPPVLRVTPEPEPVAQPQPDKPPLIQARRRYPAGESRKAG